MLIFLVVGQLGWAFVGEVASQRLRARTAGLASAFSVVFGLIFNTTVPYMREYINHFHDIYYMQIDDTA